MQRIPLFNLFNRDVRQNMNLVSILPFIIWKEMFLLLEHPFIYNSMSIFVVLVCYETTDGKEEYSFCIVIYIMDQIYSFF